MSGIYGVYKRNRAPVNPGELGSMHAVYAAWFNEDRGQWIEGNVGLGHTMQWNTPESKLENLPAVAGETGSRLVITAHTRLDNRQELIDKLGIRKPVESVTDSELILASYRKWREDCLKHLLGDFAFAIWDERASRLFCARDHMGIQPLFYRTVNSQFIFANNIEPLVQDCFASPRVKQETVAKYLRDGENYSACDTFFDDVFQLPAGNYLTADESGVIVKQYWSLHEVQPLKLVRLEDYSELLLELLKEAIRCRLRSQYPLGAHLSGGLDSSAIVACAGTMGTVDAGKMSTFSWMRAPHSGEELADPEWAMSQEIADTYQLPHLYTELASADILNVLRGHDIALGDTVDLWPEKLVVKNAAAAGIRTMLSGWGGDQLISHYGNDVYAERVLRGQFVGTVRELLRASRYTSKLMHTFPTYVYGCVLQPLFRAHMPLFGSGYDGIDRDYLDYALPDLRVASTQGTQVLAYKGVYLRRQQLSSFQLNHLGNRISSWAVSGRVSGLSYAYPLLDKRMVELALAAPVELYRKNGVHRYFFRRSVSRFEPPGFWDRNQKQELHRVEEMFRMSFDAAKAWASERQFSRKPSQFIDEMRLITDINDIKFYKLAENPDRFRKISAIKRSILALGLDMYI